MDVISSRSALRLNPNAPMFVPLAYRTVEDFSDQWWNLVQSSPCFRDYWLRECFRDPQDEPLISDIYDYAFLPDIDSSLFDLEDDLVYEHKDKTSRPKVEDRIVKVGGLGWRKGRVTAELPKYAEKAPKMVNMKVSPRTIQQPR